MQNPWTKPASPMQLLIPLDSTRLRGMSPLDRQQAVTRLANLLMEAAKTEDEEQDDDGR
jgi:hypothetical protein